jgi:hypothetical protein
MPPDQQPFIPAPHGFRQEVERAAADNQSAKLILLGLEAQGSPWESSAIALVEQAQRAVPPNRIWERVILFSGHQIDSANRKTPRFPSSGEGVAREAIRRALHEQQNRSTGSVLGVAGGANGGDLLFLEVCDELGIATVMGLSFPKEQYVKTSVENADKHWVERFSTQFAKHSDVPILAESAELPEWLRFKSGYDIWQRTNCWLLSEALSYRALHYTLIALWDGELGDGPGGTQHMVSLARERGMEFVWLNTKELFGLETPRAATSRLSP